jgi:hypothetical protein
MTLGGAVLIGGKRNRIKKSGTGKPDFGQKRF